MLSEFSIDFTLYMFFWHLTFISDTSKFILKVEQQYYSEADPDVS